MGILYNRFQFKDRRKGLRRKQTFAEDMLWNLLRRKQIEGIKFFRQFGVGLYVLDFYAPKKRLCIEADGEYHSAPEQKRYDEERTKELNALQIRVIRFSNKELLKDMDGVRRRILLILRNPPLC